MKACAANPRWKPGRDLAHLGGLGGWAISSLLATWAIWEAWPDEGWLAALAGEAALVAWPAALEAAPPGLPGAAADLEAVPGTTSGCWRWRRFRPALSEAWSGDPAQEPGELGDWPGCVV